MRFIKKFDSFINEEAQPAPAPAPNTPAPTVEPGRREKPGKRPSPIRRDKPSEQPGPKGEKKKKATEKDVAERFMSLMRKKGEDYKKFVK